MMNNRSVWQRVKRTCLILGLMGLIFSGLVTCGTSQSSSDNSSGTQTAPTNVVIPTPNAANLDDNAAQWGIFYDGGSGMAVLGNISKPSVDGTALKISLISGQPYTGIHAYRNLAPASTATNFDLSLSFYFTSATSTQALEFTMSTWVNNQRWEWATQWENIGGGSPPPWRLWTGNSWQAIGITQQLGITMWNKLHLKGNIINGQVHYISFGCDSLSVNLGQTFAPVSNPGNKLAVAVQLDGNGHEDAYQVYIDRVEFRWS